MIGDELNRERQYLVDMAKRFGLPQTISGDPYPASQAGAPLIVDTDLGGDPDDAVALVMAAAEPTLALVTTVDEIGGRRARFARHLLDLLGRPDVPVVAGADLGNSRLDCMDGLIPADVPAQPDKVMDAVAEVCARTGGTVRWAGLGPASNLAEVLATRPDLAGKLAVTLMGGALAYRDPERAQHNFRVDPRAAAVVLRTAELPQLVLSDTTFRPEIEVGREHPLHRRLTAPDAPSWAVVLAAHMAQWFDGFHATSCQHDALALSAALQLPYVGLARERVVLDAAGRMTEDREGHLVRISLTAEYQAFMGWLDRGFAAAGAP